MLKKRNMSLRQIHKKCYKRQSIPNIITICLEVNLENFIKINIEQKAL